MKKIFLAVVFLLAFLALHALPLKPFDSYISGLFGETPKEGQSLSTQEVQEILKKMKIPDAKILDIRMSPVQGLWEVAIEYRGRYDVFYIDSSHKYLIGGHIIEVYTVADRTRERLDELYSKRRIDLSRIPLEDALLLGDGKTAKKVIVFTDPDCPYCGKLHKELKKVIEKRKDIAFYIKLLPLRIHPDAYWKSRSIICSKSLKLLEDNFEKKPIPKKDCEAKEIDENIKLAEGLGITGTPSSIMPDGSVYAGFLEADRLIERIDSSLRQAQGAAKVKKKEAGADR